MVRFQATCPGRCGDVSVGTESLRLLLPRDPAATPRVLFACPRCGARTSVEVDPRLAEALQACGVGVARGHPSMGTAPSRAEGRPGGPPLDHDDLLDLHLLLRQPDWFDQLARLTGPVRPGPAA
jgi:hypothetical protein